MIGVLNRGYFLLLLISGLIVSCGGEKQNEIVEDGVHFDAPDTIKSAGPNIETYVDSKLVNVDFNLQYENPPSKDVVNVLIEGKTYEVLSYEGILKTGFGSPGNKVELAFAPYDYYDDNLEQMMNSQYQFNINLTLTKEQNDYLGYVNYDSSTENIKWDYFENLFSIYYFINENQENIPLKITDLGKTEWDG